MKDFFGFLRLQNKKLKMPFLRLCWRFLPRRMLRSLEMLGPGPDKFSQTNKAAFLIRRCDIQVAEFQTGSSS